MTDIVDRKTRSRMMAAIGPADTLPEMAVRSYLHVGQARLMFGLGQTITLYDLTNTYFEGVAAG